MSKLLKLESSNILLKGITKSMLLDTLGAILLGNMLSGKGMLRPDCGNKEGRGILIASYGMKTSWIKDLQFNHQVSKYYDHGSGFCPHRVLRFS